MDKPRNRIIETANASLNVHIWGVFQLMRDVNNDLARFFYPIGTIRQKHIMDMATETNDLLEELYELMVEINENNE